MNKANNTVSINRKQKTEKQKQQPAAVITTR